MLGHNVCCYQVFQAFTCHLFNIEFYSCSDDIPLDRPPPADVALSFTLLAQAVGCFSVYCRCQRFILCNSGDQP